MLAETMKKVVRGGADVAVRINRPMRLAIPDIEAAVRPGLSALFITKTEGVQHLRLLDEMVSELERERGMPVGGIGFGAMIEHPRALAHIDDIAEQAPRRHRHDAGRRGFRARDRLDPERRDRSSCPSAWSPSPRRRTAWR